MTELDDYDYGLPDELIAQHPLADRAAARMLVVSRVDQSLAHAQVRHLAEYLRPGDCLVLNDTRVLPARLQGRRATTGGRWSGLFLAADSSGLWQVLGKTRGHLQIGETVVLEDRAAQAAWGLVLVADLGGGVWAARPDREGLPEVLLDEVGRVPLPPYIRGGIMDKTDAERYQTVFARHPGAVAAPTAGLHFTNELLRSLVNAGLYLCRVTLHVGIGTFRPITVRLLEDHVMHREWGEISDATAQQIRDVRAAGGRVVAVGTTSMRVLETAAREGPLQAWRGETDLFIRPPFEFHCVDALFTNFHLPKSTLLVLVHTWGGADLMRRAYAEAIEQQYRFFSYGDAMLIV